MRTGSLPIGADRGASDTVSHGGTILAVPNALHGGPRRMLPALALVVALLAGACGSDDPPAASAGTERPTSTTPAPTTTAAPVAEHKVATPVVEGALAIYGAPDGAVTSTLEHPKLINGDPNAAVPLVLLVKDDRGDWLEVYLPVRPNGSTGWIKASDVTVSTHDYEIEITLADFHLALSQGDEVVFETTVAVAADNTPTPGGVYYTTELIRPLDAPDGPYGSYAYGLSGYSEVWESFNGGPGQLGIHGTNDPSKIGTQVSNGCVRMRNEDIDRLVEEFQLPLGVPVIIDAGSAPAADPATAPAAAPAA